MGFLPHSVCFSTCCTVLAMVNTMLSLTTLISILQMRTLTPQGGQCRVSIISDKVMVLEFGLPTRPQFTLPRLWVDAALTHTLAVVTVGSTGLVFQCPCSLESAPAPSSAVMLGAPLPISGPSFVQTAPHISSSSLLPSGPGMVPTLRPHLRLELSSVTLRRERRCRDQVYEELLRCSEL